jgi:hypothetical protein
LLRKKEFFSYIRTIFPEDEYKLKIDLLVTGAETFVKTEPSSLSSSEIGYIDTLNGKLVIEFKSNLVAQQSEAEGTEPRDERVVIHRVYVSRSAI